MRELNYSKSFQRQLSRLTPKERKRARQAVKTFESEPFLRNLRNHTLKGEWAGYRSISAGGDLRIHFKELSKDTVLFVAIGSHSQLYK